jgi:hypothetical protein
MRLLRLLWLAAFASLICVGSAQAQRATFVGLSGGATYGDLCCAAVNTDHRWGGTAGLMVGMRNWNYAVFTLEANWAQRGGGNTRVDYVEVPFLMGGTFGSQSGGIRGRVYTGLGLGWPIGCNTTSLLVDCDRKNSWIFSWPIGIQVGQWTRGGAIIALDVRYNLGLTNTFGNLLAHHRTWEFKLALGKRVG